MWSKSLQKYPAECLWELFTLLHVEHKFHSLRQKSHAQLVSMVKHQAKHRNCNNGASQMITSNLALMSFLVATSALGKHLKALRFMKAWPLTAVWRHRTSSLYTWSLPKSRPQVVKTGAASLCVSSRLRVPGLKISSCSMGFGGVWRSKNLMPSKSLSSAVQQLCLDSWSQERFNDGGV